MWTGHQPVHLQLAIGCFGSSPNIHAKVLVIHVARCEWILDSNQVVTNFQQRLAWTYSATHVSELIMHCKVLHAMISRCHSGITTCCKSWIVNALSICNFSWPWLETAISMHEICIDEVRRALEDADLFQILLLYSYALSFRLVLRTWWLKYEENSKRNFGVRIMLGCLSSVDPFV